MLTPIRNYAIVKKKKGRLDLMEMFTKSQIVGMKPNSDERIAVTETREVEFDPNQDVYFNKRSVR